MNVGVDLGSTKVAVSLAADVAGPQPPVLLARRTEPTATRGAPDAVAQQILRMITQACLEAGISEQAIDAIGVSSCGPFALRDGLMELAAPNLCGGIAGPSRGLPNDWTSVLLEAPLRQKFPHLQGRLRIENDGIGALQAERRWGALQGISHCAYVTWSTGVGFGLCVDGQVLRGKNGNAGHAGHMFVSDNDDALCGCGNVGDLEGLVAGNAIARRFAAQGYADSATLLTAACAGETRAVAMVDELCRVMGRALYNLVVTLDLQRISLGGGVFWHHRDYLRPRLQSVMDGRLTALTGGVALVPAGLGERVGDFGALALLA